MSAEKDSAQPAAAVVATAISVPPPGVLDTMVRVIMGQTEMTHEEVVSALERTNYDLKRVIREYMTDGQDATATATATSTLSSTNQLRFSEIRGFMDKSDLMYYQRKEMTRIYNEVLERKSSGSGSGSSRCNCGGGDGRDHGRDHGRVSSLKTITDESRILSLKYPRGILSAIISHLHIYCLYDSLPKIILQCYTVSQAGSGFVEPPLFHL